MKKILSIIYIGICYIFIGSIAVIFVISFDIFEKLIVFGLASLFIFMLYLYDKAKNNLK